MNKMKSDPLRKPLVCPSFHPGHNVHWIQAQKVRDDNWQPVEITPLSEQSFSIEVNGNGKKVWHHHDPMRLNEAIAFYPKDLFEVSLESNIVRVNTDDGDYFFYFSSQPLDTCPSGSLDNLTLVH